MSRVCATAHIIQLDMALPSVVKRQQACYMLTRFSLTTGCLKADLLGV